MADKIKILNDRQQAREKLPIFFGSRDNYKHGLKELIANAIDELKNNENDRENVITVIRESDNRITVKDNGRGIPIEGKTDGIPNFELLFLKLFAGTKYDVTESITTGTNGVGNTVLCYTSKEMVVESVRNGKKYRIEFTDGGAKNSDLIVLDNKDDDKGTSITFSLDDDVYTKTKFTIDEIDEIVFNYSLATENIVFRYIYTKDNEEFVKEYVHSDIKDYFEKDIMPTSTSGLFTLGKVNVEHDVKVIKETGTQSEIEKNSYNIILTTTPEVTQKSYLNNTYLEEGGTIHDGVLDSVRLYLNKYCRDNKLFPNKVTAFNKDDVNSSISFVAIAESNNVEFSNQTKLSTNKKQYEQDVKGYINNLLDAAKISQPKEFKKLVKHILEVQKYNTNNDKARERLKKKLTEKVEGIGNKVEKLIDCEKHGLDSELYITEGDSAMGSIIDARDDDFQATYPLRGKMLNTLKADVTRVFKNQEIVDLVKIIGTGIYGGKKDNFNIDNLRYGKIIIATDADPDGYQIAILVLTFIYKFLRPLLYEGHVYIAQTPLYELKFKDDSVVYFNSEDEKNKNINKYKDKKYIMNRLKGLGEVDAITMHETAMNPETRNLVRVSINDAKEAEKMLLRWMDTDVKPRKEMINNQLADYIDLSE